MLKVMEKGIPSSTMTPMLETAAVVTTESGSSSPLGRRNRMSSIAQVTSRLSSMKVVASRCMVSVSAKSNAGPPTTYSSKSGERWRSTTCRSASTSSWASSSVR